MASETIRLEVHSVEEEFWYPKRPLDILAQFWGAVKVRFS